MILRGLIFEGDYIQGLLIFEGAYIQGDLYSRGLIFYIFDGKD